MRASSLSAWAAAAVLVTGAVARGAVIFDNGAPNPGFFGSGAGNLTDTVQAQDFELADADAIRQIRFYALDHRSGYAGSLWWSIRPDEDGKPSDSVEVAGGTANDGVVRTATGVIRSEWRNAAQYIYEFDVAPVMVPPGRHWLLLHNGPLDHIDPDDANGFLLWEGIAIGTRGLAGLHDPAPFDADWQGGGELAFSLLNVPEPASSAAAFLGAALLACRRSSPRTGR